MHSYVLSGVTYFAPTLRVFYSDSESQCQKGRSQNYFYVTAVSASLTMRRCLILMLVIDLIFVDKDSIYIITFLFSKFLNVESLLFSHLFLQP